MRKLLSFVIPCYRSEKTIALVVDEIIQTIQQKNEYDYEIICINDSSPDNLYVELKRLAESNKKIKILDLSKNVGKHSAIMAGYSVALGDYIVTLDDDFQCPCYELWKLIEPLERGESDCATAQYYVKKQSHFKNFGSAVNLWTSHIMLDKPLSMRVENFYAIKRYVVDEMLKYRNPYPYLEGLILRVTRSICQVKMEQRCRADDNPTGFTLTKSVSLWLNGLTAFSVKPLRLATILGFAFALFGFAYGVYTLLNRILYPDATAGWASLMVVQLFVGGILMILLGLIGEYVGRIYICINQSPQYVIKETINIEGYIN